MQEQNIKNWIKKYESLKLKPYFDIVKKLTIGYGRNLDDVGISQAEADFMFDNDFSKVQQSLSQCDWYVDQPPNVKAALINMCFNLGFPRLNKFKLMISALKNKNYTLAAQEVLNSKWAKQVGSRAKDIAVLIREGL